MCIKKVVTLSFILPSNVYYFIKLNVIHVPVLQVKWRPV